MFSSIIKFGLVAALFSATAALALTQQSRPPRVDSGDGPARRGPLATTPALQWRGVERVVILCQVTSEQVVGNDIVAKSLCQRVRAIARRGAPVPVEIIGYGSPALSSPRAMVLFVQASVAEVAPSRLGLIFTARTELYAAPEEARRYFGATPRVARFTSATDSAAWDGVIAASLKELLPWLRPAETDELLPTR